MPPTIQRRIDHVSYTEPQLAFWQSQARFRAFIGGVGSGKTRIGCLAALAQPAGSTGVVAAPTYVMLRDATLRTFMTLAQESGALRAWRKSEHIAELVNGSEIMFRTADSPDRLRGPNLGWFWLDEAAMMPVDVWNIMLGRLREFPGRAWVTTTPRGPNWIYDRWQRNVLPDYELIRSSSRSNPFLPPDFVQSLERAYTGRFSRQEIEGDFLLDTPGALWSSLALDETRVLDHPPLHRIVLGVDPKASVDADSETGIIVVGVAKNGHAYVLDDASIDASPEQWGRMVARTFHAHDADRVVPEVNQGGDMVISVLRTVDPTLPVRPVRASKGKYTRAEPVAALYEQGKVHHVGRFPLLEEQMTSWTPGDKSPDRLDALVHALTDLMLVAPAQRPRIREY